MNSKEIWVYLSNVYVMLSCESCDIANPLQRGLGLRMLPWDCLGQFMMLCSEMYADI